MMPLHNPKIRWLIAENHYRVKYTKEGMLDDPSIKYLLKGMGWGNGYVLLPQSHPWYMKSYEEISVDVHCGLTFSAIVQEEMVEYWPQLNESDVGLYMIGFDTSHYNDSLKVWPKERVERETKSLFIQCLKTGYPLLF